MQSWKHETDVAVAMFYSRVANEERKSAGVLAADVQSILRKRLSCSDRAIVMRFGRAEIRDTPLIWKVQIRFKPPNQTLAIHPVRILCSS